MNEIIFISYARKDAQFAHKLNVDLQKHGISTWIDELGIRSGEDWPDRIAQAIKDCHAMIVVLSPHSIASKWVNRELAFADQKGKLILPLLYEPCVFPASFELQFGLVQRADFSKGNYDGNFEMLLESLQKVFGINLVTDPIRDKPVQLRDESYRSTTEKQFIQKGLDEQEIQQFGEIRAAVCAGKWYPSNAKRLRNSLTNELSIAPELVKPTEVIGLVIPNAGIYHTLHVSAHSIKQIMGENIETVAVIAPKLGPTQAPLLSTNNKGYKTPLGVVPVDEDLVLALSQMVDLEFAEDNEHSIELALPWLQVALNQFNIIPILIRDQTITTAKRLGQALCEILKGRRSLILVTSCLSHFYPADTAEKLDRAMLEAIESFTPERVLQVEKDGKGFANGRGAIAAAIIASQGLGANKSITLKYGHSGETTEKLDSVVGYPAVAFTK